MTSVDEHIESIHARGEDRESHGCARHAPAGHLNGENSWTKPYQYATFSATQYYQYSCNGPTQHTLMGPITITRTVSQNANGTWMYQVTKSGSSATLNPLP